MMKELLRTYLKYLEIEKNASRLTVKAYKTDLEQLNAFLANQLPEENDLAAVTRSHLRLWLSEISSGNPSRSTLQRKIASIRSFFRFLYKRGHLPTNPALHLITPKSDHKLPKAVHTNEIMRLLNQEEPEDSDSSTIAWHHQKMAILELFYSTGMRLAELAALDVSHVDFGQKQVKVMGKGAKERIIPFGSGALEALEVHLRTRTSLSTALQHTDALFLTVKGKRLYPRAIQRLVKLELSRHTEATQQSPHVLRHSFATHLLNNGADIRVIKELMGHSSLKSTQIYTSISTQKLKEIHKQAHPRAE